MAGSQQYAGFWLRLFALVIDTILVCVVMFILVMPLSYIGVFVGYGQGHPPTGPLVLMVWVVPAVFGWLYFSLFESSAWQATLGKRALGIRVTDLEGHRIGFGRATGRHFSKILSSLIVYVGFLMAAFTERKQGLHDIIAGTLVVRA